MASPPCVLHSSPFLHAVQNIFYAGGHHYMAGKCIGRSLVPPVTDSRFHTTVFSPLAYSPAGCPNTVLRVSDLGAWKEGLPFASLLEEACRGCSVAAVMTTAEDHLFLASPACSPVSSSGVQGHCSVAAGPGQHGGPAVHQHHDRVPVLRAHLVGGRRAHPCHRHAPRSQHRGAPPSRLLTALVSPCHRRTSVQHHTGSPGRVSALQRCVAVAKGHSSS